MLNKKDGVCVCVCPERREARAVRAGAGFFGHAFGHIGPMIAMSSGAFVLRSKVGRSPFCSRRGASRSDLGRGKPTSAAPTWPHRGESGGQAVGVARDS